MGRFSFPRKCSVMCTIQRWRNSCYRVLQWLTSLAFFTKQPTTFFAPAARASQTRFGPARFARSCRVRISNSPHSASLIAHTRLAKGLLRPEGTFPSDCYQDCLLIPIPHTHGRETDTFGVNRASRDHGLVSETVYAFVRLFTRQGGGVTRGVWFVKYLYYFFGALIEFALSG